VTAQLGQPLALQRAHALDQLVGRADEAGGPEQVGVDQLGLAGVQARVVELVGAEMTVLGRRLLDQRAVALPDRPQERRRLEPALVHLVVEVVDAGHDVRPHGAHDALGVDALAGLEECDVRERAGTE